MLGARMVMVSLLINQRCGKERLHSHRVKPAIFLLSGHALANRLVASRHDKPRASPGHRLDPRTTRQPPGTAAGAGALAAGHCMHACQQQQAQ